MWSVEVFVLYSFGTELLSISGKGFLRAGITEVDQLTHLHL